jgi:hypothetical protein
MSSIIECDEGFVTNIANDLSITDIEVKIFLLSVSHSLKNRTKLSFTP